MAQGPGWVPHLLTFQEQGLQRDDPPETTPIYTPDQKAYKCYWHKETPLYAQTGHPRPPRPPPQRPREARCL